LRLSGSKRGDLRTIGIIVRNIRSSEIPFFGQDGHVSALHNPVGGSSIVIIADANAMDCELLARTISGRQHSRVVGWATNSTQATSLIRDVQPDVALMSIRLSDGSSAGLTALRVLRHSQIKTRIIMLFDDENPQAIVEAFRHGARGIFCRTGAASELQKCIRCVHNGQIWASNSQLEHVVEALVHTPAIAPTHHKSNASLSGRERQVAQLIAEGLSNREVSEQLGLSEHTVKNYVFRLFEKLGISTRIELVLFVLSQEKPPRFVQDIACEKAREPRTKLRGV
jgi:DNA-binding NarL/FixJ family response regulator